MAETTFSRILYRLETGACALPMQDNEHNISPNIFSWIIYIVRCRDGSLYTGITTDLTRRIAEHNSPGGGAKYTRPRRPVTLVYSESTPSRATAAQRENQIKKLSVAGKIRLIAGNPGSGSRPLPSFEQPAAPPKTAPHEKLARILSETDLVRASTFSACSFDTAPVPQLGVIKV